MQTTMVKATLKTYNLPYGYRLHKHNYFNQYGEIDCSLIRYSVDHLEDAREELLYVRNCRSYEHAMISFLCQICAEYPNRNLHVIESICKLLDVDD